MQLNRQEVDDFINRALAEDVGRGDLTTNVTIPVGTSLKASMVARQDIVVCGMEFAALTFRRVNQEIKVELKVKDGDKVAKGTALATVEGDARAVLAAERTALNIVQHLSGIATEVRKYVEAVAGTNCTMIDTRKTIPTLRNFAKYASFVGGARNHRIRLDDGVLIKDNHIAVHGSITKAIAQARALTPALTKIEVECDTLKQVAEAAKAGADVIMFDNMSADMMKKGVAIIAGRTKTEASGGIRLDSIREKAESGVDVISVGRMTQSAPAVDIGLDVTISK